MTDVTGEPAPEPEPVEITCSGGVKLNLAGLTGAAEEGDGDGE